MKESCPICNLLNNDTDFKLYINSMLKKDAKIPDVIIELENNNYSPPTEYFLKKHKNNCLKDFVIPTPQKVSTLADDKNVVNTKISEVNSLNIFEELEKYRNMNFQEKEEDHIKRLKEIKYMSSIIIHHQLLYGRNVRATVPKEDIGALKQIEDILQVLTENTFDDEELPKIDINILNPENINYEILKNYDFPLSKNPNIDSKNNLDENLNIENNKIIDNIESENVEKIEKIENQENQENEENTENQYSGHYRILHH